MSKYPAVLYVEDDALSRSVMEIMLTNALGLSKVIIFDDSSDFEAKLAHLPFRPDIIFLDIHMKPLDGFEMLNILRSHPEFSKQPIAALTASVMNEEVARLKEAGFSGVISKPIDLDTFPELMHQLLSGQQVWRVISL